MSDMRLRVMAMTPEKRAERGRNLLRERNDPIGALNPTDAEELQEIIVQRAVDNAKPM